MRTETSTANRPRAVHLADYRPPDWLVDTLDLHFALDPESTEVRSRLRLRRNPAGAPGAPLRLDGEDLETVELRLDGRVLQPGEWRREEEALVVPVAGAEAVFEATVRIHPRANTRLEGLYASGGLLCTQCEATGFRRITWYPDRPDVLARYTVTLEADRERFPVLLSNGNPEQAEELPGGRHRVRWVDPYPKPSYLFALVAGDLRWLEDRFRTRSGREVTVRVYAEPGQEGRCAHALHCLLEAMRWDEERFGLECDLDRYNVVAVQDFNMGAMENKGLNIFNAKYVLADPASATDDDYESILGVIGHEYFHNWTGNRVTCRDWFQLSLKEGLTVFRDQEFSADLTSRGVKRIADVDFLRNRQFPEDAGPMAHPVRPESYIEMNNFYTVTVYYKGAEVVRMLHTLVGEEGFRRGMDLYFRRHDGQAVTCEDFVRAHADANGRDFGRFLLWYSQAGTPVLRARWTHDPGAATWTLHLAQTCPPTPGQERKEPFVVPVRLGLLDRQGRPLPLRRASARRGDEEVLEEVLVLDREEASWTFHGLPEPPVPSLLRGFSAPVRLEAPLSREDLGVLMAADPDPFGRWEAGQRLALEVLLGLLEARRGGRELALDPDFVAAFRRLVRARIEDRSFHALTLALPSEDYLGEQLETIDPDAVHEVREFLRRGLARALRADFLELHAACAPEGPYRFTREEVGRRRLRAACLAWLGAAGTAEDRALALARYREADNMSDALAALRVLSHLDCPERAEALADFEARWRHDPLVLDKWFAVQAASRLPDTLERVRALLGHPAFSLRNPNRVRALLGTFAANPVRFHAAEGTGYRFLADRILELDPLNPQVAARLATAFSRWRRYEPRRRAAMRAELERMASREGLSKDVYEIVSRSLGQEA